MYLAISAAVPFNDQMKLSWTNCPWVVILDPLDHVVPLLKRHLSLSRSGLTTEGVNSRAAYLQPVASMLRRQLTSASAQGGPEGHCVGSLCLHPLPL